MFVSRFCLLSSIAMFTVLSGCGSDQPAATGATASDGAATAADDRGQRLYSQCRACHSLDAGGPNKLGPNLYGIFGRKVGLAPDFAFSDAMTNSTVVWTVETMDDWLARPSQFLPGNRMVFAGIKDAQDRASLITYLQQETGAE